MNQKNVVLAAALALLMIVSLLALPFTVRAEADQAQETKENAEESTEAMSEEKSEESEEEEKPKWVVPDPKPVLLAVSFGTSYNDNRPKTIGAVEKALAEAFPDYEVRRGFTSQIIIDHIMVRDGERIDTVIQALYRLLADGVKDVLVVPTHVMEGFEYNDVLAELTPFVDKFNSMKVSRALCVSDDDFDKLSDILVEQTKDADQEGTAILWMGHGTAHEANATYGKLDKVFHDKGHANYFVGTVEGTPTLDDVLKEVKAGNFKKVVILPLMIVAGDHANNDMAGDEEDSWKSTFTAAGYEVECRIEGMGSYPGVQQMIVEHAKAAEPFTGVKKDGEKAEAEAKEGPVTGDQLVDGDYEIEVESSSSMFNIVKALLHVKDGKMTCDMTMSGKGYLYLFMGTGEEAAKATEDQYIPFQEIDDAHVFTVPVEALNQDINCAAFSKRKEQWYDRTLVFSAKMLPAEAHK